MSYYLLTKSMLQIQTGILKNIEFTIVANFILNQKILLEKEIGDNLGLFKKEDRRTDVEDRWREVANFN